MTSCRQLGRQLLERVYSRLPATREEWDSRELVCQAMRNLPGPMELAMQADSAKPLQADSVELALVQPPVEGMAKVLGAE